MNKNIFDRIETLKFLNSKDPKVVNERIFRLLSSKELLTTAFNSIKSKSNYLNFDTKTYAKLNESPNKILNSIILSLSAIQFVFYV